MHVMLCAHGAHYSTFDIYNYYKDAIHNANVPMNAFPMHNVMDYHRIALEKVRPGIQDAELMHRSVMGAARDVVSDIVLHEPTHIIFVGGLAIPPTIAKFIYELRYKLRFHYHIGYIFTESPYQDGEQELYYQFSDFIFFNDRYSARKYNPNGDLYVEYLPHSYSKYIHYSYAYKLDNYVNDVLFCGTLYPNRVEMLSKIKWDGIKYKIVGNYIDIKDAKFEFELGHLDNYQLSDEYRQSKLSINFHRQDDTGTAYSMNPRIREAIMCGSLVISDYREEIVDVFGDSIPIIDENNVDETIARLLANEDERYNRLLAAQSKMVTDTYENRFNQIILPVLSGVEELNG